MDSCQLYTLLRNWTGNQLHQTETLLKEWHSFNCPKRVSPFKKADSLLEPKILVCPEIVQSSPHLRTKSLSVYHTLFFVYFSFRFSWLDSPCGRGVYPCWRLAITLRHTALGRASGRVIGPLQKPLPDNTQHSQQTDFYVRERFEPAILTNERPQTHALDRSATRICCLNIYMRIIASYSLFCIRSGLLPLVSAKNNLWINL